MGTRGDACQGRRRTKLNKPLEVERNEEKILGLNSTDRRSELVGEELDKNDVGKLLAVRGAGPLIFFPLFEDLVEARRRSLIVNDLSVVTRNLEWFRNEIGDILSN